MFGDDQNTAQNDMSQGGVAMPQDNTMMQDGQMTTAMPAPAQTTDAAGDYMLEDGTTATAAAPSNDLSAPLARGGSDVNGLLDIKRQALQQLSPLLNHLNQTPEEKFRTTMMMIQASDDDSLLKQAYEAALTLPDEKARAQALLDVINEINYFTQAPSDTAAA